MSQMQQAEQYQRFQMEQIGSGLIPLLLSHKGVCMKEYVKTTSKDIRFNSVHGVVGFEKATRVTMTHDIKCKIAAGSVMIVNKEKNKKSSTGDKK
jgi:hypothetical protein